MTQNTTKINLNIDKGPTLKEALAGLRNTQNNAQKSNDSLLLRENNALLSEMIRIQKENIFNESRKTTSKTNNTSNDNINKEILRLLNKISKKEEVSNRQVNKEGKETSGVSENSLKNNAKSFISNTFPAALGIDPAIAKAIGLPSMIKSLYGGMKDIAKSDPFSIFSKSKDGSTDKNLSAKTTADDVSDYEEDVVGYLKEIAEGVNILIGKDENKKGENEEKKEEDKPGLLSKIATGAFSLVKGLIKAPFKLLGGLLKIIPTIIGFLPMLAKIGGTIGLMYAAFKGGQWLGKVLKLDQLGEKIGEKIGDVASKLFGNRDQVQNKQAVMKKLEKDGNLGEFGEWLRATGQWDAYAQGYTVKKGLLWDSKEKFDYGAAYNQYMEQKESGEVAQSIQSAKDEGRLVDPGQIARDNPEDVDPGQTGKGDGNIGFPLGGSIVVTSPFGPRSGYLGGGSRNHNGVDLRASIGTPVISPADGIIVEEYYNAYGGKTLGIRHGNGYHSRFAHLSGYALPVNSQVKAGDLVAYSGNSGGVGTGPHLHWTLRKDGTPVDPLQFASGGYSMKGDNQTIKAGAQGSIDTTPIDTGGSIDGISNNPSMNTSEPGKAEGGSDKMSSDSDVTGENTESKGFWSSILNYFKENTAETRQINETLRRQLEVSQEQLEKPNGVNAIVNNSSNNTDTSVKVSSNMTSNK